MQAVVPAPPPARLRIVGSFWDCQIYSGALYLFDVHGALHKINWNELVTSLPIPPELQIVSGAAFLGSSEFYAPEVLRVIQDPEIKPVVADKFRRLASLTENLSIDIEPHRSSTDNRFPFPHSDSDIHYGTIYVGSRSGVYASERFRSREPKRLLDVPSLDIATKYATIAVAGGDEGLYEIRFRDREYVPSKVAQNSCSTCEWSHASIVGSNHAQSLFVAAFSMVKENPEDRQSRKKTRRFDRVIDSHELFSQGAASRPHIEWGAKGRLYRYIDGHFDVVRDTSNGEASFTPTQSEQIESKFDLESFVDVRVAPFGSILEFDERILVLLNSGELVEFPGEPVNWRVYPSSLNYLNHLHLIYEDRLEIIAFTSDYLVPPGQRRFGTEAVSKDDE